MLTLKEWRRFHRLFGVRSGARIARRRRWRSWTTTRRRSNNPIDDPTILVGEHYHDFLNRQSDPDGQTFWTNQVRPVNDARMH